MKFCGNCGKELADNAAFCGNCGAQQAVPVAPETPVAPVQEQPVYQQPQQTYQQPQQTYQQPQAPADASSFGFAFLGFCIPLVGLILWLVWRDKTPLKAKSAGKGALIGVIVSVVCYIIYFVFLGVLMATSY